MERYYDFVVIGSGIAGLFYAYKVACDNPTARIAILTKKGERDSNTNWAQGGIATVLTQVDSFEKHFADTITAGQGLCHEDVVTKVIEVGPNVIEELMKIGVQFTRIEGQLDLGREGGHSEKRVVHAEDFTGQAIEEALLAACRSKKNQIDIFRDHIALDLLTYPVGDSMACGGVFVFSDAEREFDYYYAPVTLLASGGLCQVYFHTTNPLIATGDGVAMAYRVGLAVGNLEFVQFHPTALYNPGRWPFLISEAVRGEGGRLLTVDGRYVMDGAHPLKDLAPRDVVARAIDKELKESGEEYVMLDISHLDAEFIKKRFPNIYKECLRRGYDITQRDLPVVPAAHYACGGVVCDVTGDTELAGLYVAGEVGMCGMHGANRLASNSLLEALAMAKFAAERSAVYWRHIPPAKDLPVDNAPFSSLQYPREKVLIAHDRRSLRRIMSDFVGIVRSEDRLGLALEKISQIRQGVEEYYLATPATYDVVELRNMATVAELIIRSALKRTESRGLHYMEDYPDMDPAQAHDTIIRPTAKGATKDGSATRHDPYS